MSQTNISVNSTLGPTIEVLNDGGIIINVANPVSGTGDVTSSSLSLDNQITRFDGTSGKIIQNSGITIADGASGTLAGTNSGDVTIGTANGLSIAGQALSLGTSSASTTGALTSTDWQDFDSKQDAGNYITELTGDITASGPGSAAATLASTAVTPGAYTLANITVDSKGRITSASNGSAGTGTVTSVGITGTDGIQVDSGSPVTTSGSIQLGVDATTMKTTLNLAGTNTGDQNLFGTFAVAGQSDVVADSTSDTLTLVAGSNITITTNASTDSITINSTASGSGDVVGPASATDNALVRFDGTTGKIIQNSGATINDAGEITALKLYGTSGVSDGAGAGGAGGSVFLRGGAGSEDGENSLPGGGGGSIDLRGGDSYVLGEVINSGGFAGGISTVGSNASSVGIGNNGGNITTSGSEDGPGGSINTAGGGGSIDTKAGYIELGENGSRTTLQSGATSNYSITFPPTTGSPGQVLGVGGFGITDWITPAGGGDVVGPASSTSFAIAQYSDTTGKLIKDSSITIVDGASGTLSGTNSGDQNLFGTIAVAGQSNVVADSTNDTLTLVAGTNITITTNNTTDEITINNSLVVGEPLFIAKTNTETLSASAWTDISGLSLSFTATSITQKILVRACLLAGNPSTATIIYRLVNEDGTLLQGDAAGNRLQAHAFTFLNSTGSVVPVSFEVVYTPGTISPRTYKVQWYRQGTGFVFLNRSVTDTDSATFTRTASTLFLQSF